MDERFSLFHKTRQGWIHPIAEVKNLVCSLASGDLLLISDCDVILDIEAVKQAITYFEDEDIDAVVFIYKQHSLFGSMFNRIKDVWINHLRTLISRSGIQPNRSGIYMIRKEYAVIPDLPSEYDPLQMNLRTVPIQTKTLHLRPKRSRESQMQRGRSRAKLAQYSLMKTIIMSILQLEPFLLKGFLLEMRRGGSPVFIRGAKGDPHAVKEE